MSWSDFTHSVGYSNPFIITAFTAAFREMEFELRSEEKFGELAGRLGRVFDTCYLRKRERRQGVG